jgi:7-cyano-7-deazaguanine synthase in queuosine biosynthesis
MTVMSVDHNIYCSGIKQPGGALSPQDLALNLWLKRGGWNLFLNLDQIHSQFYQNATPRFIDFLEIATYVYCADQVFKRGGLKDVDQFGADWRRHLHFHVPVRDIDFWNSQQTLSALEETLHFLSDDYYQFSFVYSKNAPELQGYLKFSNDDFSKTPPERVMMFSGGLDSLGGAIQESVIDKRKIMLVNHRSTKKLNTIHKTLMGKLIERAGDFAPDHMHVDINKKIKAHNREYTQRTRSFLFLALGSSVANMLELDSLRFYENGVISFNLPFSAQTVGSRSTRTTHPKVLHLYSELVSLIAGKPFKVENPFLWKTRGDIIKLIIDAGCSDLIQSSMSCAHVWESSKAQTHCGKCSQCIDRRIGMFAVGADKYDPESIYRTNVFLDAADKAEDQLLNAEFLERANRIGSIKDAMGFFQNYSELGRALQFIEGNSASALSRCYDLYQRHANEVTTALDILLQKHASAIRKRTLAADCMLRMVHESNTVTSAPAAGSAVPVAPENIAETGAQYLFQKSGSVWKVRFNGASEFSINDTLGAKYIDYLLHHPGDVISSLELEQEINTAKAEVRTVEVITQTHDEKSLLEYAKECRKLRAELKKLEEEGRTVEAAEAEDRLTELERILKNEDRAVLGDSGEKARGNVRKAIGVVQNSLKKMAEPGAKSFALHISNHLSTGFKLSYSPPEKIIWS